MRALIPVLLALPGLASAQVTASVDGECGGPISMEVSGLTPGGIVHVVTADELGDNTVPAGVCAGTDLGLGRLGTSVSMTASPEGTLSVAPTIPDVACGRNVIFFDAATCTRSDPARMGGDQRNVTFNVDMGCSGEDFTDVFVTGPWADWTDEFNMTDPDGDGVYSRTISVDRDAAVEYKYMVDSWASQEDLIDDMIAGRDCAPITDYYSFANRLADDIGANQSTNDAYGKCGTCGGGPVDVDFTVDMRCAGFAPSNVALPGPDVGWDYWARSLTDDDGDGIWNGTFAAESGEYLEFKIAADEWAYQEDLIDDMVYGAECAPVTDYFSFANRLVLIEEGLEVDISYGSCEACDPGDVPALVTFEVDLRCSDFSPYAVGLPGPDVGWDFWARTLTDDDGDGIWTGAFEFDAGAAVEYTIALDEWSAQEALADDMAYGAECAPVTDYFSFANRLISATDGLVVSNTYDSCDECVPAGADCDPATEVELDGRCYYIDGSGGACDPGYELAPQSAFALMAPDAFVGKNYKNRVSDNCCVWHRDQDAERQDYGMSAECNASGPFTVGPVLGGAGCTDALNLNPSQLTFCMSM